MDKWQKSREWKFGYTTFEFDITDLVRKGQNDILVIVVYQDLNTRWYSGAGIFRDVTYININTPKTYLVSDRVYFSAISEDPEKLDDKWNVKISCEIDGESTGCSVTYTIFKKDGEIFTQFEGDGKEYSFIVEAPHLWGIYDPFLYCLKTELKDKNEIFLIKIVNIVD